MKIGILGSSFNPPHNAHLKISEESIKIFGLDEVWWMITKKNPLKNMKKYLPFKERMEKISSLINTKKIKAVHFEDEVKSNFLIDNIKYIKKEFSNDSFIFLMGSDSFTEMNKWKDCDEIFNQIPIAVFNRQSSENEIVSSEIAKKYKRFRISLCLKEDMCKKIPSWIFIGEFNENISSTLLRSQ